MAHLGVAQDRASSHVWAVRRVNLQDVLARADLPMPPKAPASPRHDAVSGAARILAARPDLVTPGGCLPSLW